jgi:glycine C-acetyltransferase
MMSSFVSGGVPASTLTGSLREFRVPEGNDLLGRVEGFYRWQDLRRDNGLWPYCRSTEIGPKPFCATTDDAGHRMEGVNFGSQDYLSLSSHPAIKQAARDAIDEYGVHSAGSPAFIGNTRYSLALERKIAEFGGMEHTVLFPTGFAAGVGVIKGLVRSADHVVIDMLAHACLHDGAAAATRNVHVNRHLETDSVRRRLANIRAKDKENGILVVTEGLFSMDSDTPDLEALQNLCHEYRATLMVDVAHDWGCLGEDGRGHIGLQKMIGKIDIIMGSFSKTFGSNGGFVICKSRAVKEYLRYFSTPGTFSNALSPIQAAIVLKAFDIIDSAEGRTLRASLMRNILSLREQLRGAGFEVYGDPSAIVCVKMGTEAVGRLASRMLPELGLVANLVEYPAVPKGQARFRMQVMAEHSQQNIVDAVQRLRIAYDGANAELARMGQTKVRAAA